MWPFKKSPPAPSTVVTPPGPGPSAGVPRDDSWESAMAQGGGFNQIGVDKRMLQMFTADQTNHVENTELWRGDDLGGRIVETIPNEMMRQGFTLTIEDDQDSEDSKKVMSYLEDLDIYRILWTALCFERAYGGAAILLGVNDLQQLAQPLNPDAIVKMDWMEVFEPIEMQAITWQTDPTKKGFGQPLTYRLNPISPGGASASGVEIHVSRLIVFPGIRVSRRQVTTQAGWGDAMLTRCRAVLRDFQMAWNAAGILVNDFSQSIYKIKGLAELISLDKDAELKKRIAIMEYGRTVARAMVLDADGEEFERKTTNITGLPELLTQFATRLAAAADIPVTLLMGMSPAGLNATGDSDIRTFYDRVASMQVRKLRPAIERLSRIAFSVLEIDMPDNWHVDFNPLWQPTEAEQATARFTQMQTDVGYITNSVLSDREVRLARFGGAKYNFQTQIDPAVVIEPVVPPAAPPAFGKPAVPKAIPAPKAPVEHEDLLDVVHHDFIEERDGKFHVMSEEGTSLASYDTRQEAVDRLGQIEWFKSHKKAK